MKEIGAQEFKTILKNGIEHLMKDRELMNQINVFPVADGDTGDNLVNTFLPIYRVIDDHQADRIDTFTAFFASEVLTAAKGNSGVIFSQFFFSFAKHIKGKKSLNTKEFASAMEKAVQETYDSIQSPKEGTILTVLRHTAAEFNQLAKEEPQFSSMFAKALHRTKEILEKTREMLPQLRKARVVDSGGLGFYLFLKGMGHALIEKKDRWLEISKKYLKTVKKTIDAPDYKYCCQWNVVPRGHQGKAFFLNLIKPYGGSITISGDEKLFNIHIHSDHPQSVASELEKNAEILTRKIDDLEQQKKVFAKKVFAKKDVAIVIDSGIDLPEDIQRRNGLFVVPIYLSLDGHLYRDRVDISQAEFFRRLAGNKNLKVKTSQPAPADFKEAYQQALQEAQSILVFTITSVHSGTYFSALSATNFFEDENNKNRTHVIDTQHISGGSGLLVLRAIAMLQRGETLEHIIKTIESCKSRIVSLIYLENLDYAVRGGRVKPLPGSLVKLLGCKPLLTIEQGTLVKESVLVSGKNREAKIVKRLLQHLKQDQEYSFQIIYSTDPAVADTLEERLRRSPIRCRRIDKVCVTPVLAVHSGPGAFGIFALSEEP